MSTLIENVQKVKNAHAALKTAIAAKGVAVPDGTKLTDMPALVGQISTEPVPTNNRVTFMNESSASLTVPGMVVVDMAAAENLASCFYKCEELTSVTLQGDFGRDATDLGSCFSDCKGLVSLTLSESFGRNAVTLSSCFSNCNSLTSLTLPDRFGQNAENLRACFSQCIALSSLTVPEGFGQNAENLAYCFNNSAWRSLTLPSVFGQGQANLGYCFSSCIYLSSLTLPAGFGQNAKNIEYCFNACYELSSLTLPEGFGSVATNIRSCFYACHKLVDLHLPEGFGQNATRFVTNTLAHCIKLTNITGNPNFKASLNLSSCTLLTHDSLMVIINGLQTVTTTQTLTLGATNLAKLTDAEKKIATDKGWTLA